MQKGMDVEVVERVGHSLKSQAGQIESIMHAIDALVNEAVGVWQGPDAQQFHNWWNTDHRPVLVGVQHAIDGLGQSALNNASDQDNVSNR